LYISGMVVSPLLVYLSVILYGIGGGMPLPVLMAAVGDIFQGKHLGKIIGIIMLGGFLGGALGAWLGGYMFDRTHSYDSHFVLSMLVTLISGALIWKARPSGVRVIRMAPVS
jgi:MFS family permease